MHLYLLHSLSWRLAWAGGGLVGGWCRAFFVTGGGGVVDYPPVLELGHGLTAVLLTVQEVQKPTGGEAEGGAGEAQGGIQTEPTASQGFQQGETVKGLRPPWPFLPLYPLPHPFLPVYPRHTHTHTRTS